MLAASCAAARLAVRDQRRLVGFYADRRAAQFEVVESRIIIGFRSCVPAMNAKHHYDDEGKIDNQPCNVCAEILLVTSQACEQSCQELHTTTTSAGQMTAA